MHRFNLLFLSLKKNFFMREISHFQPCLQGVSKRASVAVLAPWQGSLLGLGGDVPLLIWVCNLPFAVDKRIQP